MALDTSALLMQLSPARKFNFTSPGETGMEREQLRLMRERFAEEKRRNAADERLRKEAVAASAAQNKAEAEAAMLDKRRAGLLEFTKAAGSPDPEAGEAMIPYLNSLGSGIDITRSPSGLPSYRVHFDAKADAEKEAAEANRNWEAAERPIYEYPYQDEMEENPLPSIKPVTPTGDVLDLQALQDQRLTRLRPAFEDIVKAHPYDYRENAAAAAAGVERLGLPVDKATTEFRQQLSGPIDLVKAQLENEAQQQTHGEPTEVQKSSMRKTGASFIRTTYNDQKIGAAVDTVDLADRLVAALTDDNPAVQSQAGQLLLQLGNVKGIPSDKDLGLALGDEKLSAFDKVAAYVTQNVQGGFGSRQKEGLLKWAKMQKEKERERLYKWLDSVDRTAASKSNTYEREGVLEYRNSLPAPLLAGYEEWRAKKEGSGKGAAPGKQTASATGDPESLGDGEDLEDELLIQAGEHGFDPDELRPIMSGEGGGADGQGKNKRSSASGVFQFTDKTAKAYGLKNAAAYRALPVQQQVALGLQRFKDLGLDENATADDFAVAQAAPTLLGKPPETVVYRKDSDEWNKNPGWRPADGGDITIASIQAYYRKHRGGGQPSPESKGSLGVTSVGNAPSSASQRARELLEKARL